ncbi:MAG: hypothetical protein LWX56_06040 [Ignavibacteria bacterium]|nr:hypothetical protein [Ignavibacteria bacterium]
MKTSSDSSSGIMNLLFVTSEDGKTDFYPLFPLGRGYHVRSSEESIKIRNVYLFELCAMIGAILAFNLFPRLPLSLFAGVFGCLLVLWVVLPVVLKLPRAAEEIPLKRKFTMAIQGTPDFIVILMLIAFILTAILFSAIMYTKHRMNNREGMPLLIVTDMALIFFSVAFAWILYKKRQYSYRNKK